MNTSKKVAAAATPKWTLSSILTATAVALCVLFLFLLNAQSLLDLIDHRHDGSNNQNTLITALHPTANSLLLDAKKLAWRKVNTSGFVFHPPSAAPESRDEEEFADEQPQRDLQQQPQQLANTVSVNSPNDHHLARLMHESLRREHKRRNKTDLVPVLINDSSSASSNNTNNTNVTSFKNTSEDFCRRHTCCQHWRLIPNCTCDPFNDGQLCGDDHSPSVSELGKSRCGLGTCQTTWFMPFPATKAIHDSAVIVAALPSVLRRKSPRPTFPAELHRGKNDVVISLRKRIGKLPSAPLRFNISNNSSRTHHHHRFPRARFFCNLENWLGLTNVQLTVAGCLALALETGVPNLIIPTFLDHRTTNEQLFFDVFDFAALQASAAKFGLSVVADDEQLINFQSREETFRGGYCARQLRYREYEQFPNCCVIDARSITSCDGLVLKTAASFAERTDEGKHTLFRRIGESRPARVSSVNNSMSVFCADSLAESLEAFFYPNISSNISNISNISSNISNISNISSNISNISSSNSSTLPEHFFSNFYISPEVVKRMNYGRALELVAHPERIRPSEDQPDVRSALAALFVRKFARDKRRDLVWQDCRRNLTSSSSSNSSSSQQKQQFLDIRIAGVWFTGFNELRSGTWLPTLDWLRPAPRILLRTRETLNAALRRRTNKHNATYLAVHFRTELDAVSAWKTPGAAKDREKLLMRIEALADLVNVDAVFVTGDPFRGNFVLDEANKHHVPQVQPTFLHRRPWLTGATVFDNKNIASQRLQTAMMDRIVVEEATVAVVWDPFRGYSSFSQKIYDFRCRRKPMTTFSYSQGTGDESFVLEC